MNKNLNFIPNPGKPNKRDFDNDTANFYWRIILRAHFGNSDPAPYEGYSNNKNSNWTPKEIHHSMKTFIELVNNDLKSPKREHAHHTPPERALNSNNISPEREHRPPEGPKSTPEREPTNKSPPERGNKYLNKNHQNLSPGEIEALK